MILSFDKFERYELPQVTLCNPNSRATEVDEKITITDTVGVLSNPKGMNLKLNFNAPHELSFDYYRHKSTDPIKQSFYDSIYEAIQTDRYVYLTDIGYFIISSVSDSDEDNIDKKSISLKSCEENELATAEGLYLKEGMYYLHTDDNDGLLDLFLPKTAGWTMGYIDPSLLTKPYYVEETEVDNGYNFLYTTVQDMYECIVEPDIIKRTISVYSRVYYAEHHLTDIHIAKYNLLKHKTVEENDEDKYTALNVQGKDENLEIRAVNPTGKNVIYNFEPRYSWMSPALQQAIEKWQEKCESVEEEYLTLQQGYYTELEQLFKEEQNIEVLKGELKTLEETRDAVIITVGEQQSTALKNINVQITAKQKEINSATSAYNSHKETVNVTYETPLAQINSDCALDLTAKDIVGNTIFTVDLLNELMTHIKPTDYVDEYMLVTESMTYPEKFEKAKELMDRAQSQLVKISSGQKTYSIDTRSFLFNKQFKHFSEQLCTGAIIYVETKNDIMEQLHLTGIDINFDEKTTSFTLGNKYDRSDLKALYEDALGQNSKSFSELKYIAGIIEDQRKQLDYQRNWVADLRTLTLDNVLTSEDQAIEINNRGLIGRKRQLEENGEWAFDENGNPLFDPEQVKLINNTLVFTDRNWQNATTAVGKIAVGYNADGSVKYAYGINGQVLIGELILGNNLVLTGTGAGIKIKDSNGNDAFYADNEGNLVLSGTIFANKGEIAGWNISTNALRKFINIDSNADGTKDTTYDCFIQMPSGATSSVFTVREASAVYDSIDEIINSDWTDWTYNFQVRADGTMVTKKGTIGGWTLGTSSKDNPVLYCAPTSTIPGAGLATSPTATDPAFWAGYGGSKSGHTPWDYGKDSGTWRDYTKFYVTQGGELHSIAGTIGGWTINNNVLSTDYNSYRMYLASAQYLSGGGSHWIRCYNVSDGTTYFSVSNTGRLTATGANITGTINAGSVIASGYITDGTTGAYLRSNNKKNYLVVNNNMAQLWHDSYGEIGFSSSIYSKGDSTYQAVIVCKSGYKGAFVGSWHVNGNFYNSSGANAISSDINKKNTIEDINYKYENMFDNLKSVTYKYNDGTSNRTHTGFIAQGVKNAMDVAEISTTDFAGLVIENQNTDDENWYLRYEEFIALNTWQIQKAKARITDLENAVAELKTQIQALTAG